MSLQGPRAHVSSYFWVFLAWLTQWRLGDLAPFSIHQTAHLAMLRAIPKCDYITQWVWRWSSCNVFTFSLSPRSEQNLTVKILGTSCRCAQVFLQDGLWTLCSSVLTDNTKFPGCFQEHISQGEDAPVWVRTGVLVLSGVSFHLPNCLCRLILWLWEINLSAL